MVLPVEFEQLRSTFNHHRHPSVDSVDDGTDLHKTDGSIAIGKLSCDRRQSYTYS